MIGARLLSEKKRKSYQYHIRATWERSRWLGEGESPSSARMSTSGDWWQERPWRSMQDVERDASVAEIEVFATLMRRRRIGSGIFLIPGWQPWWHCLTPTAMPLFSPWTEGIVDYCYLAFDDKMEPRGVGALVCKMYTSVRIEGWSLFDHCRRLPRGPALVPAAKAQLQRHHNNEARICPIRAAFAQSYRGGLNHGAGNGGGCFEEIAQLAIKSKE